MSEFVKAIGVTQDSYLIFMDRYGPDDGCTLSTYERA